MLELIPLLLLSILIVFISALLFVNAIEFLGSQYKIGGAFVGSILSPLFTSLPELIVLIIAVFGLGGVSGEAVGVGTIFGEPLMASSLSYGLVGMLAFVGYSLKRREHKNLEVDTSLAVPFIFVTILFPLTLIPSLLNNGVVRVLFGLGFLGGYFGYLVLMYRRKSLGQIENAKTPYVCKIIPPKRIGAFIQLIVSVVVLYFGASEMVSVVNQFALGLGLSVMGLAIIVVPAATAVPETASTLIWGFRGQDILRIASLVGEKVLYTTLFPGIGLLVTAWVLDIHAYLSVLATTTISVVMLFFILKKRIPWYALTFGFLFFVAYAVIVFWLRI